MGIKQNKYSGNLSVLILYNIKSSQLSPEF